jgi:hypothetical protein
MRSRRNRTVSGRPRCRPARLGRSECSSAARRQNAELDPSGGTAALLGNLTPDIICADQSHPHHCALGDENLHSLRGTSPGAALHQQHDDGAPRVDQPCACASRLPLPQLVTPVPRSDLFCAVTPIDDRGRLADRSPVRAAGWAPGQPVTISATHDRRLVIVQADGLETITRHGHLRLPARIRHACGLLAGDRLLVTVTASPRQLTVYPMTTAEGILRELGSTSARTP